MTNLGGLATFECELSKPGDKVQWLKAGKPIKADKKYEMTQDGSVYRLLVHDVKDLEDLAEYSFTASGGLTSKAKLLLQGELKLSLQSLNTVLTLFHVN